MGTETTTLILENMEFTLRFRMIMGDHEVYREMIFERMFRDHPDVTANDIIQRQVFVPPAMMAEPYREYLITLEKTLDDLASDPRIKNDFPVARINTLLEYRPLMLKALEFALSASWLRYGERRRYLDFHRSYDDAPCRFMMQRLQVVLAEAVKDAIALSSNDCERFRMLTFSFIEKIYAEFQAEHEEAINKALDSFRKKRLRPFHSVRLGIAYRYTRMPFSTAFPRAVLTA